MTALLIAAGWAAYSVAAILALPYLTRPTTTDKEHDQ